MKQENETGNVYVVMVKMDDDEFIQAAPRNYTLKMSAFRKMHEMQDMPEYAGYIFKVMRHECITVDYSEMFDGCNNELESHVMKFLRETCQKQQIKRFYGNGDTVYYHIYTEVTE